MGRGVPKQRWFIAGAVAGDWNRARDVSKALTNVLRHSARQNGIAIDDRGWVSLADALAFLNGGAPGAMPWVSLAVTEEEVREVVSSSDKKRFEILDAGPPGPLIRAAQGHSMAGIEPDLALVSSAEVPCAVHGTYWAAWKRIEHEGLRKMSRNHIHLATGPPADEAVVSGMRALGLVGGCGLIALCVLCSALCVPVQSDRITFPTSIIFVSS